MTGEPPRSTAICTLDSYAGFAELYESAAGRPANVTEVAWAHVRRKYLDVHKANGSPIAHEALERIGALFEIERTIAQASRRSSGAPCARVWPRRSLTSWPDGSTNS